MWLLCNWDLNSIVAHEFSKLSILETNDVHQMHDVTCLSETYLDSPVPYDDPRLNLSGYKLFRDDNLSNNKRDSAGIYFKETFAIGPVPNSSLKECLTLEVFIGNKKGFVLFVLSLYTSPSKSQAGTFPGKKSTKSKYNKYNSRSASNNVQKQPWMGVVKKGRSCSWTI